MTEFFLHSFNTLSHVLIGYAVPFLFVLTIVVFFHELGHFLVARWAGVKVLTFSLGFGDRHGRRWKISAVPLGGYVKFFGDDTEASTPSAEALAGMTEEERAGSFHHKKGGPPAATRSGRPARPRRPDSRSATSLSTSMAPRSITSPTCSALSAPMPATS